MNAYLKVCKTATKMQIVTILKDHLPVIAEIVLMETGHTAFMVCILSIYLFKLNI